MAVIEGICANVKGGLKNVQGVFLKCADSVALPVYQLEGGAPAPVDDDAAVEDVPKRTAAKAPASPAGVNKRRAASEATEVATEERKQTMPSSASRKRAKR